MKSLSEYKHFNFVFGIFVDKNKNCKPKNVAKYYIFMTKYFYENKLQFKKCFIATLIALYMLLVTSKL